jgi:hypothetical protein
MSRRRKRGASISLLLATLCASPSVLASADGHEFTSLLGFELNTVTLGDIRERLGDAPIVENDNPADHNSSICYLARSGIVRFLSAEPGGEVRELLGFEIEDRAQENTGSCVPLPLASAGASLQPGGLRLGMTRREFATVVGENVRWEGDIGRRFFAAALTSARGPQTGAAVSIVGRFAGERLIDFKVWRLPIE